MSSFQKSVGAMFLAMMGMAELAHSTAVPSTNTATVKVFQPDTYLIFPSEQDRSEPASSQLQLQAVGNSSILENLVVFHNLPATATHCTLHWEQAAIAQRSTFIVDGSGLLDVQQLVALPEGDVTYRSVATAAEEAVAQGKPHARPDMTSWPADPTAQSHIAGPVDCAETIYLKVAVDLLNGDGFVYFRQDAGDGLMIEAH